MLNIFNWVEIKNSIEILEDKVEKIFAKQEQRENEIVYGEKIRELEDQSSRFNIMFSFGILNKEEAEGGHLKKHGRKEIINEHIPGNCTDMKCLNF